MSPLPVLAEVLSMTESGTLRPAVALAIGYAGALAVIAAAAVLIGERVSGSSTGTSRATEIFDLVAGVVLLGAAVHNRRRAIRDPDAGLPRWLERVGSMSTLFAFALGAFLPPYVVAAAAGNQIVRQSLPDQWQWVQGVVFVAVASLGVVTPIVVVAASPGGAEARLATWRRWLERHWTTVVFVLLVAAGAYLVAKGVTELVRD